MNVLLWIGAVLLVCGIVATFASWRKQRDPDLGVLSGQWIAQHRGNFHG